MLPNITCSTRKSSSQQPNSGQPCAPPSSSDPVTELEELRKFSLNSLMALLAILSILESGKAVQSVVLTLLIYTISLRLVVNTCFLRNYPTLARFLHVVPLLSTASMAGVVLVGNEQSPALATVCLLFGVLPLVVIVIHYGRLSHGTSVPELPIQMQDVSVPGASASGDTTLVSS